MTSESTPGTAVPERAVAVVATVGALVLLAGVGLSARGPATADLPTVLVSADAGTVLVTSAGERAAQPGDAVPRGARVRTPAGASAALGTDGRTVRIAPESEVVVVDGATQRLERGAALVDAQDGPGVRLLADGSTVAVHEDALVRVDRERLLRVAAYAGPRTGAADVTAPGRRRTLEVRRLHQLQVAAGGLPGHAVPLALRAGDPWERDVVPAIVEDDAVLEGTVRALSRMPSVARTALPTGLGAEGVPSAERALAYALAHAGGGFDQATYLDLQDGRTLGGSWGVLAALEGVSPSDADRFFDDPAAADTALAAGADGGALDPSVLAAEVLGTLPGLFPGDDGTSPDGTSPDGGGSPDDDPTRPDPTSSPRPDPTPGPSRDPVREVVDAVVDAVEDVLPAPLPSPLPLPEPPPAPVRPPLAGVEVQAPLVDEIPGAVDTVGDTVGDAVEAVGDTVGDTVGDAVDSGRETVRDVGGAVGGAVSGPAGGAAGGPVRGAVGGTVGGVVGGLPRR